MLSKVVYILSPKHPPDNESHLHPRTTGYIDRGSSTTLNSFVPCRPLPPSLLRLDHTSSSFASSHHFHSPLSSPCSPPPPPGPALLTAARHVATDCRREHSSPGSEHSLCLCIPSISFVSESSGGSETLNLRVEASLGFPRCGEKTNVPDATVRRGANRVLGYTARRRAKTIYWLPLLLKATICLPCAKICVKKLQCFRGDGPNMYK